MNKKILILRVVIIISILINVILISGCVRERLTSQPSYVEQKVKPETGKSEIGRMQIKISSDEIVVSEKKALQGKVQITVLNVPEETKWLAFSLQSENAQDIREDPPNLGQDNNGADGWGITLDTAAYDNGGYVVSTLAFSQAPSQNVEPIAVAQKKVTIDNPQVNFPRNYPSVIKGNWEPSTNEMSQILNSEVEELKELGVNTVSIVLEYNLNKDGSYYLEDEEFYISLLRKAKSSGFAVLVSPNFVGASGHDYAKEGINLNLKKHLQNSEEVALKWAEIAEKYQAEFFAPQNEFNGPIRGNFAVDEQEEARITTEWHREMLPKLRKVFTGKLLAKLDTPTEEMDVSGYDYVGMTISHGNGGKENVRKWLSDKIKILKKIGEKSKAHWLISEAWFPYGGPWYYTTKNENGESLDELQDDYFKISLEEYVKTGGKDYIFIAWLMPGMKIKDRPAEEVIREYFKSNVK